MLTVPKANKELLAATLLLPLLLSGCSWVPDWADPTDWFEGDEAESLEGQYEGGDDEIPNLATVPDEPRAGSSTYDRDATVEGLQADQSNALYSDQSLQAESVISSVASSSEQPTVGQVEAAESQVAAAVPQPEPSAASEYQAAPQVPQTTAATATSYGASSYAQPAQRQLAAVIYFQHGSSNLDSKDMEILRGIAQLQRERGARLAIVGHSSSRTGVTTPQQHQLSNLNVSMKRANRVASALRDLGVEPNMVRTQGLADTQPVYHEFMATGEAGNRRAEIFLEY